MEQLQTIQQQLNVPKAQRNTFGNYNFRSLEDILEAVKPLLKDNNLVLIISDEIINIGTKNYVKATATLFNSIGSFGKVASNTAYAREAESQKGMNDSQLTGSTSSYARKYALNGLFAIDDNKDSDFTNKHDKTEEPSKPKLSPKSYNWKIAIDYFATGGDIKKINNYDITEKDSKLLLEKIKEAKNDKS